MYFVVVSGVCVCGCFLEAVSLVESVAKNFLCVSCYSLGGSEDALVMCTWTIPDNNNLSWSLCFFCSASSVLCCVRN